MKKNILLSSVCLFVSAQAFAAGPEFLVLMRQQKTNRTYYTKVEMPDLVSDKAFDGKYFKIVKGKDQVAVSFDEADEKVLLRASNTYYHLNKSRDFWVNEIKSEFAASLPKITVRLDIVNQFDEQGHFANDNRDPQFNNALSVPGGETPVWAPRQERWGNEIWFRPMKTISSKELPPLGTNPLTQTMTALRKPVINYTINQFTQRVMEQIFYPAYVSQPLYAHLIRTVGTIAIMEVIIQGSKLADNLFVDKYYYLDTAMIPEITAHEYAHVVLSENLEMSHSTPVNEGLADYFAAVESGKRKVYQSVRGISTTAPKDTHNKKPYSHWEEANRNASSDFTLSVLWDVRETLGEEVGDKVVYEARKNLSTDSSNISHDLLKAIILACDEQCKSPKRDKLLLYETFSKKGF